MKEFIYRIEDNESDESEVFIGWIRKQGHELIRCKDCKLHGTNGDRLNCAVFCCTMPDCGFCFCGERKEHETES